ncbi:MAG: LysR family transcriptional regulator [Anaerolineae bacterium]|nr:LysR family transcriptional regulator [Anaerolineae bacterium]
MMKPQFNLWLEINGEVGLSIWRVRLLQAVGETGSISAAAAQLGIHYRTAWQKIHEMETRLGQKLVETQTGGHGGGGATLTPTAQAYLDKFNQFSQQIEGEIHRHYQALFDFDDSQR